MKRLVSALSDAVIRDMREVTITGRIVGEFRSGTTHTVLVQVPADTEIQIGDKS
jgi:hypothetical protein